MGHDWVFSYTSVVSRGSCHVCLCGCTAPAPDAEPRIPEKIKINKKHNSGIERGAYYVWNRTASLAAAGEHGDIQGRFGGVTLRQAASVGHDKHCYNKSRNLKKAQKDGGKDKQKLQLSAAGVSKCHNRQ